MALIRCTNNALEVSTLWTNSTPTAQFATQTVTLSDDINNFSYVGITFRFTTSDATETTCIYPVADFKNFKIGQGYMCGATVSRAANANILRRFEYVSDVSIHFSDGTATSGATTDNSESIPIEIFGLI